MSTLPDLLKRMVEKGGSDLHLTTNTPPQIRIDGELQRQEDLDVLAAAETKQLIYSVLTDGQKRRFEESKELDFSFGIRGMARFRCNVFNQRGAVGAVYRVIPEEIKSVQDLGLPAVVAKFGEIPRGLVLVTGPTGSGKSTTLAALLDKVNVERHGHILTIEDPIEYVHQHKSCVVNQREVHSDTDGFSEALRAALREDPDVVLIGEMRDLETIEAALRIAETGHLTFATLHTNSAVQTINRIIDVFPVPSARAGPHTAVTRARRDHVPVTGAEGERTRPCGRAGDPGADTRHPQPDSRGQAASGVFGHAVGAGEDRDADHEPGVGDAASKAPDHAATGDVLFLQPGRVAGHDQSGRRGTWRALASDGPAVKRRVS